MTPKTLGSFFPLQLTAGVFFLFLGLLGILPQFDESFFSLANNSSAQFLESIVGIFEMVIGAILIFGLFRWLGPTLLKNSTLIALLFWLARILITQFVYKLGLASGVLDLGLMTPVWWMETALMGVLAATLWTLHRGYKDA